MFATRSRRSRRRAGPSPRRRRGAAVVMFAVFLMLLMMFVAIAADFGRVYVARNALQTAADASAMAGAVELVKAEGSETKVIDATREFANRNALFHTPIDTSGTHVTVEIGKWNDETKVFTPGVALDEADAVRATVWSYVDFHFAPLFGIGGRNATAMAIGWAGANVASSSDCLKPWTIPLKYLKKAILGPDFATDPYPNQLTKDDQKKLDSLLAAGSDQLDFTLKQGTGSPDDNSGNFYSVSMPVYCPISTKECDLNDVDKGNKAVTEQIESCSNTKLEIGDVLLTQPGEAAQPTINAIENFCEAQTGSKSCAGVPIKASFFTELSDETKEWTELDKVPSGRFPVEIAVMASFEITEVKKDQEPQTCTGTGKDKVCTQPDPKATITGRFIKQDDAGHVGPAPSLLKKTILVK